MVFTQVVSIKDKAPGTKVYNYADSFWCTYIVSVVAASVAEICEYFYKIHMIPMLVQITQKY